MCSTSLRSCSAHNQLGDEWWSARGRLQPFKFPFYVELASKCPGHSIRTYPMDMKMYLHADLKFEKSAGSQCEDATLRLMRRWGFVIKLGLFLESEQTFTEILSGFVYKRFWASIRFWLTLSMKSIFDFQHEDMKVGSSVMPRNIWPKDGEKILVRSQPKLRPDLI